MKPQYSKRLTQILGALVLTSTLLGQAHAEWTSPEAKKFHKVKSFPTNEQGDQSQTNPGNLDMYLHVPADMPEKAPLVVVLHGCTQSASLFNRQSGWSKVADQHKFYVVYPEQKITSDHNSKKLGNPYRCFNWAGYYGERLARGEGENQSIIDMINHVKAEYSVDDKRIFVTGFSAGGSMTMTMLGSWPEVFAGGAPMAGVTSGCANSVDTAFACAGLNNDPFFSPRSGKGCDSGEACMDPKMKHTPEEWVARAKAIGPKDYNGPYPRVIAWQSEDDELVAKDNLQEIAKQWSALHGIAADAGTPITLKEGNDKIVATAYAKGGETPLITVMLLGLPHAIAVDPGDKPDQGGSEDTDKWSGGYAHDQDIYSAYYTAKFWGIAN